MKVPRREHINRTHQREVFPSNRIEREPALSTSGLLVGLSGSTTDEQNQAWVVLSVAAWICRQARKFLQIRLPGRHVEEVQYRTTDFFATGFFAALDFDMFGYGHVLTSLMFRRPRIQID